VFSRTIGSLILKTRLMNNLQPSLKRANLLRLVSPRKMCLMNLIERQGKWNAPILQLSSVHMLVNTIDPAISSKTRDLEISENFPCAILQLHSSNQPANQWASIGLDYRVMNKLRANRTGKLTCNITLKLYLPHRPHILKFCSYTRTRSRS
jgi:hypothetical protein